MGRHEGAAGASIYVGAKHAVEGITKSVALEIAKSGISEEVADGIVFIASDEAKFITGHVLNVDGGHSAN